MICNIFEFLNCCNDNQENIKQIYYFYTIILIVDLALTIVCQKLEWLRMAKRITVVLDNELVKKLRIIQSKKIAKLRKSVSFSRVVNEELRNAIK